MPNPHRGRAWNRPAQFSHHTTPDDPLGWRDFRQRHLQPCLIEGPWEAPVDWSDTPDGSDWFFVVGYGRSGTSVLSAMLSEHPDVYCGCEDHTVFSVLGLLCTRWLRTQACDAISYDWHRRKPWAGRQLRCFAEAWRWTIEMQAGHGIKLIGDKSPQYLARIGMFRKLFPGCRFLYTVRHPLDQLSSLLSLPPGQSTIQWQDDIHGARRLWSFLDVLGEQLVRMETAEDALVVRFEDFFCEGKLLGTMGQALDHIGADIWYGAGASGPTWMRADVCEKLRSYARAESPVGRWLEDDRAKRLVDLWVANGIAPEHKVSAVVSNAEHYTGRMLDAWQGAND